MCFGDIADGTQRIRVGAGGVMLPNHAPVVAEQFGTLAPCTRAASTSVWAARRYRPPSRALRRSLTNSDRFPQDVVELQAYFDEVQPGQHVQAVPAAGTHVPLWILGSSTYGAQLAAELGLPYAFASHFAPDLLLPALEIYRSRVQAVRSSLPAPM